LNSFVIESKPAFSYLASLLLSQLSFILPVFFLEPVASANVTFLPLLIAPLALLVYTESFFTVLFLHSFLGIIIATIWFSTLYKFG